MSRESVSRDGVSLRSLLCATALLLTAGVLFRAAGLPGGEPTALADMIGTSGDYTAMTTFAGAEELLFLIDARSETLMVYRVENGRAVQFADRQDLRSLFTTARAAYLGSAPGQGRP